MSSTKGKVIKCKAAVVWEQNKPLTVEEIEVSPPKAKEVRVKIAYAGVCHTDVSAWKGVFPFRNLPAILGHEGSGVVESVGDGVTAVEEGDHVVVYGMPYCRKCPMCQSEDTNLCAKYIVTPEEAGFMSDGRTRFSCRGERLCHFLKCATYSEYTVLEEDYVIKVPKEAPLDKVCLLSCGVTTGYGTAVKRAKVRAGSTCVVFGLGTVGLAAAMGCRRQGAKRIIGVDINNGKKDIAKTFGVTEFYNPSEEEKPIDVLLTEKTHGGCDYAFECVGNTSVMESAIKSCRIGVGRCQIIGGPPSGETMEVDPYLFLFGRTVDGCILGDTRMPELPQLVEDYKKKKILLDEFITETCSIEGINKTFEHLGKGNAVKTVMFF